MLFLDGEKTVLCNLCTFFLVRQIIFRFGKQIVLTDVAVEIFPNGKKILKFRLVIGEAETASGKNIKNAKRQRRPDGFCGNVQIDLAVGEDQRHLCQCFYKAFILDGQTGGITSGI